MNFLKKAINAKKIIVVDIGTYKVKTAICSYKNGEITIDGYGEKRQEASDVFAGEIADLEGVCNAINDSIAKAYLQAKYVPKDIIINTPTSTIIGTNHNISYKRNHPKNHIDNGELDSIISKIEFGAIKKAKATIEEKSGYKDINMKLITSSITNITIDNDKVSNPIGFSGEEINIGVSNIFIPSAKYTNFKTIAKFLNKNIISILPLEFSIPKIIEKSSYCYNDILIVDIGSSKTNIIVQKGGVIVGFNRINIGINDLVKLIKQNHKESQIQIIQDLNNPEKYINEKKEFFKIWMSGISVLLNDIIVGDIIPNNIYLIGGGSNNNFIKDYIREVIPSQYDLKVINKFRTVEMDLTKLSIINMEKYINNCNIGLMSMIYNAKTVLDLRNDPITKILKNIVDNFNIK